MVNIQLSDAKVWLQRNLWDDSSVDTLSAVLRIPIAAVVAFVRHQCIQKAAALTFSTLLALVPLLAIMFALLKGLGAHNKIEPLLLKHLTVGSEEVVTTIISYINNTNVGSLGSVGLLMLVFTVLALISNIEKSFNALWLVDETRTLFRRFADYFSVVTLGPLFLLAAISMNTSLRNQGMVQWLLNKPVFGDALLLMFEILPFVVIWLAFIFLYLFVPNTKVKISSAALGGIGAGTLWLVTQWGYITFQYGVAKYNAIYGTMAALPIFMVWIYLSWMIALFGLELCWAHQNRQSLGRLLWHNSVVNWQPLQVLQILLLIYRRFQHAEPCWRVEDLLEQVDMPRNVAQVVLDYLQQQGVVIIAHDEQCDAELVTPLVPITSVDLNDILTPPDVHGHLPNEINSVAQQMQLILNSYIQKLSFTELLDQASVASAGCLPEDLSVSPKII